MSRSFIFAKNDNKRRSCAGKLSSSLAGAVTPLTVLQLTGFRKAHHPLRRLFVIFIVLFVGMIGQLGFIKDNDTFAAIGGWREFTLYFDANGGSGAPDSITVGTEITANTFTIPSTIPTRPDYNFLGWGNSSSDSVASYQPGDPVTLYASSGMTKTLYAVWEEISASITLSINNPDLALNLTSNSTSGSFGKSSDMNISVTTNNPSGYTLSFAATNRTSLNSGGNSINSIGTVSGVTSSGISENDYKSSNNTQYNNTWAYKPSTIATGTFTTAHSTTANSNYLPLPDTTGRLLAITDSANSTAHEYTLSIGARINSATPIGTYTSDAFVITAVANVIPLTVVYDGNGLTFNNNPNKTSNTVLYSATSETIGTASTGTSTKYSHTSNINDSGVASGTYPIGRVTSSDTVTISGASNLSVTLYYALEPNYDYLYVFAGSYNGIITGAQNTPISAGQAYTFNGGTGTTKETANTTTFTIPGDTVTFALWSDPNTAYYGYYAVVTSATIPSTTYNKNVLAGTYMAPSSTNNANFRFLGWSEDPNATVATYTTTEDIRSKLPYISGDTITLYAVWNEGAYYMQDMSLGTCQKNVGLNGNASGIGDNITVLDKRDNKEYTIRYINGQCWMTQNLRFQETTLNSTTSNVSYSYTEASPRTMTYYDLAGTEGSSSDGKCYGTTSPSGSGYS